MAMRFSAHISIFAHDLASGQKEHGIQWGKRSQKKEQPTVSTH